MQYQEFFENQIKEWPLALKNYESQGNAIVKDCFFGEDGSRFRVRLVCLPERIGSSSARITAKGQVDRPCFLCAHRLPPEQKSLPLDEDFSLLVNPFPVFPQHFTLPAVKHQYQRLRPYLRRLMRWTGMMDDMVLFYNGGRCGASAPDHLHFQAGNQGVMPMQCDFHQWKESGSQPVFKNSQLEIRELRKMLRQGWVFEGNEPDTLSEALLCFLDAFEKGRNEEDFQADDHVNLLCWYEKGAEPLPFKAILFPRAKHRPSCFFEEDESRRRVTSPASVEMGGYYILPRREDFERMQDEELVQIYKEVCLEPEMIRKISRKALSNFTSK